MTAQEAIRWVDDKKHNVYSVEDKLIWLSQVEAMAGELAQRFGEAGQTGTVEPETVLSVQAPYDQLYLRWLEAQMDYTSQEYLKYNNAMAVFNTLWTEYANHYCRKHLHPQTGFRCFGR